MDIQNAFNFAGRTYLLTGVTGTIGQSIAQNLSHLGARVIGQYRQQQEQAQALAAQLPNDAICLQGNLESAAGISEFLGVLSSTNIVVDGLVNNAADQSVGMLEDLQIDQWQRMLDANLTASFALCQWLVKQAPERGASIVNISSIEGADPALGHGHYACSKAGLDMLTRSLAQEVGSKNIRVNGIAPGLIRRDGIEDQWPEGVARWQERAPLSRLGEAQDVANAVAYLLSDAASFVSGATLLVDGGMSAQSRW